MSRAAPSKTRGVDKTKPPASQTPVIAHEIVPGKFNDNDWNVMVDRDGADEFVMDIVDELMETTMSAIYDKYIERQLLPFTITQARDAITEIIEWQFLARDEGELQIDNDLGWSQDEEPEPAVTDCWAQGSVPKNFVPPPEEPLEEIPEEAEGAEDCLAEPESEEKEVEEPAEPPELADTVSETDETPKAEDVLRDSEDVQKEQELKKPGAFEQKQRSRTKFRPYKGKIKSAGVKKMTESLEETEMKMMYDEITASMPNSDEMPSTILNMPASCTSILKVQTGRPPGNKDVVYDDLGNVVAVMKLDPEKLPTHKVNVKYHVVDPAVEAAQARLDAMRKGKSTGSKIKKVRSTKSNLAENVNAPESVDKKDPLKKKSVVKSEYAVQQEMKKQAKSSTHVKNSGKSSTQVKILEKSETQAKKPKSKIPGSKLKVSAPSSTMAPLPPPLRSSDSLASEENTFVKAESVIEEMEVSHGVVIREGGRVKKGPGRYYGKLDILEESQKGMTPVALRITNPGITVADLLDRHTPILRPLPESSPLPPIVPQTAQHAQHAS